MKIITMTLCDWSDDGHGKTETYTYYVNIESESEIVDAQQTAVLKAKKITELSLNPENYHTIPKEVFDMMLEHFPFTNEEKENIEYDICYKNSDLISIWRDAYMMLCIGYIRFGNPNIIFQKVKDNLKLNVGGYMLF